MMNPRRFVAALIFAVTPLGLLAEHVAVATEFHVSSSGNADGNGSRDQPWDLQTALAHPDVVKPGDTIWVHGGTYRGSFRSDLEGRKDARIVVRQAIGERAVFDLQPDPKLGATAFYCYGSWTRYHGFEVTCSNPKRRTKQAGSWPTDIHRGSIECRGSHLQFVNLVVHDLGSGFGFWSEAAGGEIYGCLIYNNGFGGPDRGHGHGIYAQNKEAVKYITDNIIFQQFGGGVHVYGSAKAYLKSFRIEGNLVFYNGCLHEPDRVTRSLLVGGEGVLDDVVVQENMIYNGGLQIGYSSAALNRQVAVRKNYVVGMSLYYQDQLDFEDNTVIAGWPVLSVIQKEGGSLANHKIDRNTYYNTHPKHYPFFVLRGEKRQGFSLEEWRREGFDRNSQMHDGHPSGVKVFVRPNQYEPGRANIAVFNWDQNPEVRIDLSHVLKKGQQFRIVSVRNFHGPAVLSGTYQGGPVSLPMRAVTPVQPVGMPEYPLPVTEPEFGGYVVLSE